MVIGVVVMVIGIGVMGMVVIISRVRMIVMVHWSVVVRHFVAFVVVVTISTSTSLAFLWLGP